MKKTIIIMSSLLLVYCGSLAGLKKMADNALDAEIKGFLATRSDIAREYSKDLPALFQAVQNEFKIRKIVISGASGDSKDNHYVVETEPVKVEKLPGKWKSGEKTYPAWKIEKYMVHIKQVEGKNTVYIRYLSGKSFSDKNFKSNMDIGTGGGFDLPEHLKDPEYYKDFLNNLEKN